MLGGAKNESEKEKKKSSGLKIWETIFSGCFFKMLINFTNLFYYYVNFINILKK